MKRNSWALLAAGLLSACGVGVSTNPGGASDLAMDVSPDLAMRAGADLASAHDLAGDLANQDDLALSLPVTLTINYAQTVVVPGSFTLTATSTSAITRVEFLQAGTKFAEADSAPFASDVMFTAADNGTQQFTAVAYDADGHTGTSRPLLQAVDIRNPPTFVGAGTDSVSASAAAVTPGTPSSVVAQDLMLAFVAVGNKSSGAVTASGGWTLLPGYPLLADSGTLSVTSPFYQNSDFGFWIYSRVAGAGEPATYSFTIAPAAQARAVILAYRGVDGTKPIDVEGHKSDYYTVEGLPDITTTRNHCMLVDVALIAPAGGAMPGATLNTKNYDYGVDRYISGNITGGLNLSEDDDNGWGLLAGDVSNGAAFRTKTSTNTDALVPYISVRIALAPPLTP